MVSTDETMDAGDLVWINTGVPLSDMVSNIQSNPANRRVPLTILGLDFPVTFADATYYDDNGDGFIDRVRFNISGPVFDTDLSTLQSLIRFPSVRSFTVNNLAMVDSSVVFYVTEQGRVPRTSILRNDRVVVSTGRLPGGGFILPATLTPLDSVAPVIVTAHLDWYGNSSDTLKVTFSEPVKNIFSPSPFMFKKPGETAYSVQLHNNGVVTGAMYTSRVIEVLHSSGMQAGDSVWINTDASIDDLLKNVQDNIANRRVLLTIESHYNLRVMVENNPFQEGVRPLPLEVREAYARGNLSTPSDGLVIIAEPSRLLRDAVFMRGTVSIYDVVHNPILQGAQMVYDSGKNRLYYIWDGYTNSGRKSGPGTYMAVVKISDQTGKSLTKMVNLGVRR